MEQKDKFVKREYLCKDGDMFETLDDAIDHTLNVLMLDKEEKEEALGIEEWFDCKNCGHRIIPINYETEATHYDGGDNKCLAPDEKQENLCKCKKPELITFSSPTLKGGVSEGAN